MGETFLMLLLASMQAGGAYLAFNTDGVLAKLLGLLFCIVGMGCIAASLVFYADWKQNQRKGNEP